MIDDKDAIKSLNNVNKKGAESEGKLTKIAKTAGKVALGLGAMAVTGAGALFAIANSASETASRINDMSQKLMMSTTGFQEWDYVLRQNGISIDSLQPSIKKMNDMINEASNGNAKAAETFEKLGLSIDEIREMKSEDAFDAVMKSLQGVGNESERVALANDLLGRSSTELAPIMNMSGEELDAYKQKAHELGIVMSEEAVVAGDDFGDKMDDLKDSFQAVKDRIGLAVMPMLQKWADWVLDNMPMIIGKIDDFRAWIEEKAIPAIGNFFDKLKKDKSLGELKDKFGNVIDIMIDLLPYIDEVIASFAILKGVTAIAGTVTAISNLSTAIGIGSAGAGLVPKMGGLAKAFAVLSGPAGWITLAIAALVGYTLATDEAGTETESFTPSIVGGWKDVAEQGKKTKGVIDEASNAWGRHYQAAADSVSNVGRLLANTVWKVPSPIVPKFAINGGFDFVSQRVPTVTTWYADGAIFNKPTLFNTPYGYKGVGEAGAEVVSPLSKLQDMVDFNSNRDLLAEQNSLLKKILAKDTSINIDGQRVTDVLFEPIDEKNGFRNRERELAYGGI